ncbi:MAG: VTT domain-containing protein [Candidatus Aenigmarchaeota archaeon]|nr:VTT domain-containing protein [Candidatus Aenigmarchaeota archaeon]
MVLEYLQGLITQGSYIAIFLASLISSASVFLPIFPSYIPIIIGIGAGLNPVIVGLLGGIGSALGESVGYFVGLGGSASIERFKRRTPKFLKRFEGFYSKIGFWVILIFAFIPSPFDIIGVMSGASKYDLKKFLLALFIGRISRAFLIAYASYLVIPWALRII